MRYYYFAILTFVLIACNSPKEDVSKPDDNRFTPVVLTSDGDFDEPMAFEVLPDGKVFVCERKGTVKVFNPSSKTVSLVGTIRVNTKYTSQEGVVSEAEEGLMGLSLDPDYVTNHFMYLYYAHPDSPKHVLSRWEIKNDQLVQGSERIVLNVPTQRETCCHTGGGMTWNDRGDLYLTIGNNTGNVAGKSQTDERPGRSSWDDQRGSGNTNDLRGKILRIHPEKDGNYSIPDGNLFPKGTPKTRPEIYTMGHRNPWRPSIDSKTGWLYWGEVGPDATEDTHWTKAGMDELNQARKPGFFGWPYFIGENRGYPYYDYVKDTVLNENDPKKPVNHSVNNTGLTELPEAQPAFISYPYAVSEKFPEVGTGARCAVGGPVFHKDDFKKGKRLFPAYYEGKWIAADLSRGWIMSITMNEKGDYKSMERFLPSYQPIEPIDIKFGPEGDLYVLEYGNNWFRKSDNAKLVRIEYNSGNRTPVVKAGSNVKGGKLPLKVNLSSEGTIDFDKDPLKYEWTVVAETGGNKKVYKEANPKITLDKSGIYHATLKVTDPHGASNSQTMKLIAGNEPPVVNFNLVGNQSFYFPSTSFNYDVKVNDLEDGNIDPDHVAISIDYVSEGWDEAEVIQQQRSVDASTRFAVALSIINKSDCNNCHHLDTKSIGPMFTEIAAKYSKQQEWALDSLSKKLRSGGSGVWGDVNMPAHPGITVNDARTIVNYILHSSEKQIRTLPISGQYQMNSPEGDNGKGTLILRAAYTDRGASGTVPVTTDKIIKLSAPQLNIKNAEDVVNTEIKKSMMFVVGENALPQNKGSFGFKQIDMTGINKFEIKLSMMGAGKAAGGKVDIHTGNINGPIIGSAMIIPVDPFAAMIDNMENGKNKKEKAAPASKPKKAKAQAGFPDMSAILNAPGTMIDIQPTNGFQNIYFVFSNDQTKLKEPLMTISAIKVHSGSEPQMKK